MTRGRPKKLQERFTTSLNIEAKHQKYLISHGIELSDYVRKNLDALIDAEKSTREQLLLEIQTLKTQREELDSQIISKELQLKEFDEKEEAEQQEGRALEEFEMRKREYIVNCINTMQKQSTYNQFWWSHLSEAWKFKTFDEAKAYVRDVWLDEGVPDKKIKVYLRMN